jgi:hypothetical protein
MKKGGAFGGDFAVAKNSMQGMMDMYGGLDSSAPVKKPAATAKAGATSKATSSAKGPTTQSKPSASTKATGISIGNAKSPVVQAKPLAQGSAIKTPSAAIGGRQATMSTSTIAETFGQLRATLKPVPGDIGSAISSKQVLERPGLKLYDFSDSGHQAEQITDQEINSMYQGMAKASEIYQNPTLTWNISPINVKQGNLGDCYILGSMSVVANQPENIKRLLTDQGDSAEVWLCDSGCWRQIKLKKTFPMTGSRPTYASAKDNCIWQMVLEKAFACMYKGYDRLELGHSSVALRELTGCATEYIELDSGEQAWVKIKTFLSNKYIITGSSKVSGLSDDIITPKHCYAVLDAKEATVGGKTVRYLRVMNPVSQFASPPPLNAEAAKQLGSGQTTDTFWYQFASVLKNFEVLTCCKIKSDLCYSWSRVKNPGQKRNTTLFRMTGTTGDSVSLSFNHKNLRHYGQQTLDTIMKTKYGVARIIAFQFTSGSDIEVLGSGFHALQNVKVDFKLEKGSDFYVFVDIDYEQNFLDEYTIAASSSHPIFIQTETGAEAWLASNKADFIKALMFEVAERGQKMQLAKTSELKFTMNEYSSKTDGRLTQMVRHYGQALGYIAFVYLNNTTKYTLEETLVPAELKNVYEYWPPKTKIADITLQLRPGEAEVILLKFGPTNNCSHTSRIQSNYKLHY